ncbi:hypothetical protein ACEQ8H_001910 [Pleosporales sp. CAS-2024a]
MTRNSLSAPACAVTFRKLAMFVQAFAPYFHVLGICTRVKVEWPGCFWALIKLLFQAVEENRLFSEKVANMFEAIASILPPYHHMYAIRKRRLGHFQVPVEDEHLTMLMSYVYADLVRLCLDLYRIFFRNVQSFGSRQMAPDPTVSAQWRPLDSRFAQIEARLTHHRRWLAKETESQVQDFAVIEQHRQRYLQTLHRQSESDDDASEEIQAYRLAKRVPQVDTLCDWLSNSPHSHGGAANKSATDHLGSLNWFLSLKQYHTWKQKGFDQSLANDASALKNDWHDRVLFVQAEAGFGKTVISSAVLNDLAVEAEDPEYSAEPPSTACFQIKPGHQDAVQPADIFRKLTLQLLYHHQDSHATLDAVCLLLRKTSFQATASASDIQDILLVLLRQHPTFLIVDGLDACSDEKAFLSSLAELCRKTDVRTIIFSRPTIRIPLEYQKWASDVPHIVALAAQHNAMEVERHLHQHLEQMASEGLFSISMDRAIIQQVVHSLDWSFLRADLFLNYLRSTALSSDERWSILLDAKLLEGLDPLYSRIFETLERRSPHEKRLVSDVTRWLTYPVHQLCASALRTALLTSMDKTIIEDAYSVDILQALSHVTCGLVQTFEDTVSFVHGSVRDYLMASVSANSEFSLHDECRVHTHLAARCLSYLARDIPQGPLAGLSPYIRPMTATAATSSGARYRSSRSGDSGYKSFSSSDGENALPHGTMPAQGENTSTSRTRSVPFDANLPFLRYASLCWPIHVSRALAPNNKHHSIMPCAQSFGAVPYIPALSALLSSRLAVTAWVEASFRYNLPPTLTRLVGPLSDLKGEPCPGSAEGRELRLVVRELRMLSERLMELKRGYATSLRDNPSLIWQIGDRVGEGYWPVWDAGTGARH